MDRRFRVHGTAPLDNPDALKAPCLVVDLLDACVVQQKEIVQLGIT